MSTTSLMDFLSIIPDPRIDRGKKHKLEDILVIAICGVISACETWVDIEEYGKTKRNWFEQFLDLENGIPSHDTFGRVFSLLEPEAIQEAFFSWVKRLTQVLPREIVSIDGKSLRGSIKQGGKSTSTISIVSAWASQAGVVLGQKSFEITKGKAERTATEELIELLYLKGCIVTLDANGATPSITKSITRKKADFIVGLKNNQKALLKYCKWAFEQIKEPAYYQTQEKSRDRKEIREYHQIGVNEFSFTAGRKAGWERQKRKWPTLNTFGMVKSTVTRRGKTTQEFRYFFSSMEVNIREFERAVRSHWEIENKVHWILDVAFREDESRVRTKHAAENLAIVRRLALNLLKKEKFSKRSVKGKRLKCAWDNNYLLKVLTTEA